MAQNYRTDRHLNPVALTTSVAKSLGWKQGVDYEVGDSFKTESGSVLHTARLKVPEGMSALEFTKKKFDDSYNSGADVFYTKSGQPRWTHTEVKKEDWMKMDDNAKLSTIYKMYKNEGGSGSLSKGVTYAKEPGMIEKGLKAIGNFLVPSANASDGKDEPMYAGGFKAMEDMPMGSGGFVAKKAPQLDFSNQDALIQFVDENGGIDGADKAAWNNMKKKGYDDLKAIGIIAKKKAYQMENPEKTLESSYVPEDGTNTDPNAAEALGRTGLSAVPLDYAGRPEAVAPEALEAAKQSILSAEGGYESFANSLKGMDRKQKAAIPEDQKQAFLSILKEKYEKFANAGPNGEATPEAQAAFAKWAKDAMYDLAAEHTSAMDYQTQVFGFGASADEKMDESNPLSKLVNPLVNAASAGAKGLWRGLNILGWNPVKGLFDGSQNTAEGLSEGNLGKAASGLMGEAGSISGLGRIGAAITAGLNNLAKTDAGAAALSTVMAVPGWTAEQLISIIPGIPEDQKADYVAAVRDMIVSGTARGVTGSVSGGRAGLNASPAASSASKVGSAALGSVKQGAVEFAKGLADPFKTFLPTKAPKVTAKQEKIVSDAAKRVKTAAVNAKSIGGTAAKLDEAALTDSAASISELRKMGFEVNDAKGLMDAVEVGGDAIFNKANDVLKGKKIDFDGDQLAEGIALQVKNKLGHELSDSAKASIADAVKQIDDNISSGGKVVANYDKLHKVTQALYDTILNSKNGDKFRSVDAPEVYLAAKEVLYKQLSKVKGFEQYIDSYQKLSRLKDVAMLIEKKFGSDVANKPIQELVPPSWIGIMAGSAVSGNGWITASAVLAGLANYTKSLKKSPTQMFKDLDKVSRAMDAAGEGGYDALNSSLGITKKPLLGQDAVDITKLKSKAQKDAEAAEVASRVPPNFMDIASEGTPSAPISKPAGRSADLSGFDVGTPVSTPRSPLAPITGPTFGQPGFAESLGIKSAPKAPEQMAGAKAPAKTPAPSKKPVQSPEEVAKLKAEIAAENAKASASAKKAPTAPKATKAPEKTKAAPKAKETEKPMKITAKAAETIRNVAKQAVELSTKERLALVRSFDKIDLQRIAQVLKGTKSGFLADVLAELNSK